LQQFGLVEDIVWNKRSGNIIGGHQRYFVLLEEGISEVDVKVVDLDEIQEKVLNITLNNANIQGDFDNTKLSFILNDIKNLEGNLFRELCLDNLDTNLELIKDVSNIKITKKKLVI
jgi:ParB-like chromosome segregation protein Spo0J